MQSSLPFDLGGQVPEFDGQIRRDLLRFRPGSRTTYTSSTRPTRAACGFRRESDAPTNGSCRGSSSLEGCWLALGPAVVETAETQLWVPDCDECNERLRHLARGLNPSLAPCPSRVYVGPTVLHHFFITSGFPRA